MNVKRLTGFAVAALMAGSVGFAHAATVVGSVPGDSADAAVSGPARAIVAAPVSLTEAKPDPAAQQAMLEGRQQQLELINRILDKFQPEAGGQYSSGFDSFDWRLAWGARMMYQPTAVLASALAASNLATAQGVLAAQTGGALKHGSDNNLTVNYLTTPCRIVDTRVGGGGLLGPVPRYWSASDAPAIIAAQGGAAAGCGLYPNASSWIVIVTVIPTGAVGSGGANFLTIQHESTVPTTTTMIYYPGTILSNFATSTNYNGVNGANSGGFWAYASLNTHVAIDLVAWTGSPTPAAAAALQCEDVVTSGTVPAGGTLFLSSGACTTGYTRTSGGSCQHTGNYNQVFLSKTGNVLANENPNNSGANASACAYYNTSGAAVTGYNAVTCCRMPAH